MRRLIADLRPTTLDELGLGAALEALSERLAASDTVEVEMNVDLDDHTNRAAHWLAREIEDTVYRLVQEALNNVARHGGTDRAKVDVTEDGKMLRVRVADKGDGFDPRVSTEGFGLTGTRERVTLAGGTLEITKRLGRGTTIIRPPSPPAAWDEDTEQDPLSALSA